MADIIKKTKETAGADEMTPSKAQYFSWINNTNEGATEKQTRINEYFKWLKEKFGMQIDIYAWDAGNLDGSSGTYQTLDSEKIRAQYPRGYGPSAEAARELGIKLGVWCGPDGFGDTPEEEAARHELMVSLCRDYNFGLFKMDAVCGRLREEKQDAFVEMMKECRKYSPELILLNHRLDLGRGMPYGTTTLMGGEEAYIDVNMFNKKSAPHHREYMLHRMNPEGGTRLTEDHGVCISSCIDYFEDELVLQAFRRSLILAPEIYANPWLMRDEEHARLARIYNLHRTYRDILVDGVELPATYGWCHAMSRGNGEIRFITAGSIDWCGEDIFVNINGEIGIDRWDGEFVVSIHHPYEKYVGTYRYGDRVKIGLPPFRAVLIEVARAEKAYPMLTNCSYEVLHETAGVPDKVKIYEVSGKIEKLVGGVTSPASPELADIKPFDNREGAPVWMDPQWTRTDVPENVEQLYETAMFAMDNDSLETRSLKRSGETKIPQVKAARDAFFAQPTYKVRGCDSAAAFDGGYDTFFDGDIYSGGLHFKGGCLRVDLGGEMDVDCLTVEYFDPYTDEVEESRKQTVKPVAEVSCDLSEWRRANLYALEPLTGWTQDILITCVHNIVESEGELKKATYAVDGAARYIRIPEGYHHIYRISVLKNGKELQLTSPKALNIYPAYNAVEVKGYRTAEVTVPADGIRDGSYITVTLDGRCGDYNVFEGGYVVAELDGVLMGCPDRAPSYMGNAWESPISRCEGPYSYYLPITDEMKGKKIKLHILEMTKECADAFSDVYICEDHSERDGIVTEF